MRDTFMDGWDVVDDPYDWRCHYCGQGFFDGADRHVVDEENCCEACRVDEEQVRELP